MTNSVVDEAWPPQSARQALLSSPSGRKRYADFRSGNTASPVKRRNGTPTLLDKLRLARNDQDELIQNEDEEDDEETLQLKLAAIEAKLKLKKLQNKAKQENQGSSLGLASDGSRPAHVQGSSISQVEVELSPVKRPSPLIEQKSPSRVLLGIDKGVRGADISLRRARTIGSSPNKSRNGQASRTNRQTPAASLKDRSSTTRREGSTAGFKSFSERMADVRDGDRKQIDKHEDAIRARARNFKLDKIEMEKFKTAAEESQSHIRPRSPLRDTGNVKESTTDHISSRQHQNPKNAKTIPDSRSVAEEFQGDASRFEGFSELHLSSRILPHSFLKRTLPSDQFTIYRIPDLLKNITSPAYEIPDDVGNFVVFGIIASKSHPLDQKTRTDEKIKTSNEWEKKWDDGSQNRKKFMALTLTDLTWTVDLYLFDTALPRYHRLSTGTVIAVLNPSIMPPKRAKVDTGAFSLALHDGDDTVLEIGTSKDLGYCNAVKKDGKECGQWVNSAKSEICEWHLNAQIAKTQARRMGVNAGANGFGSNGSSNNSNGFDCGRKGAGYGPGHGGPRTKQSRGFDMESGSHYYVSSSNANMKATPVYNPNISTARMLDLDSDDPFVAEGQFSRDKGALLQKRMSAQEKERSIAKQLSNLGSGSSAGAGYMRRRVDNDTTLKPRNGGSISYPQHSDSNASQRTSQDLKTKISRKRAAEDVRLSPIKKTRFLTDRGIKEAGRESLGPGSALSRDKHERNEEDDDDDLDIV